MKPQVYIETTIPSYLTAWPSRDLVRAAHQQITREWWGTLYKDFIHDGVAGFREDSEPRRWARKLQLGRQVDAAVVEERRGSRRAQLSTR